MNENNVVISNLIKKYGNFTAVNDISFSFEKGEVFGLIGPNGSGKTTTLRILSTLLQKTSGEIEIFGFYLPKDGGEVRELISYIPEDAGVYRNLTGREYLKFITGFYNKRGDAGNMTEQGIEISNLKERINDKVDTYSKGMIRRLLIARAIVTNPQLLILDEPTSGLDVVNAKQVRELIKSVSAKGVAVLLSSHNMLEVEFLCRRISLISKGTIVESGTPEELKKKHNAQNIEDVFMEVVK
ncbi:TPA: multidrug ABC transporter ATP-binding protein [candidate division WOR-3 bacterium]|jgi:ABC-2 type transport system ATP-binding protein|uniref:Multidrug ABC transporter ATP-binding protein n=1 Tax=candidate division WOR-3 bacterium TaxID=2052148 RepID=A0A350HBH0_UNCW3|nr:multidrug ABC transporter ATP-binding protein [candidate division WOR-3 bacterium]